MATLKANLLANVIRNLWANAVIFCGHFPDGAEKFSTTDMADEGRGSGICVRCSAAPTSTPGRCWRS